MANRGLAWLLSMLDDPELLEICAAIEHARWASWEKYRERCVREVRKAGESESHVARWARQRETPYAELSERERESDRVEARKTLLAIRDFVREAKEAGLGTIQRDE